MSRMTFVKRALRDQAKYIEQHSLKRATNARNEELYGYMVVGGKSLLKLLAGVQLIDLYLISSQVLMVVTLL